MHNSYRDITDKINEQPKWYDENGVPRYCEFHPSWLANIYAAEAALVRVACQACHKEFSVGMAWYMWDDFKARDEFVPHPLAEQIKNKTLHYGDPPNAGCCPAGPTMNCDDLYIEQFWRRDETTNHEWRREIDMELALEEDPPLAHSPPVKQ